jgi:uncharacterized protein (UPF0128 family)
VAAFYRKTIKKRLSKIIKQYIVLSNFERLFVHEKMPFDSNNFPPLVKDVTKLKKPSECITNLLELVRCTYTFYKKDCAKFYFFLPTLSIWFTGKSDHNVSIYVENGTHLVPGRQMLLLETKINK